MAKFQKYLCQTSGLSGRPLASAVAQRHFTCGFEKVKNDVQFEEAFTRGAVVVPLT